MTPYPTTSLVEVVLTSNPIIIDHRTLIMATSRPCIGTQFHNFYVARLKSCATMQCGSALKRTVDCGGFSLNTGIETWMLECQITLLCYELHTPTTGTPASPSAASALPAWLRPMWPHNV